MLFIFHYISATHVSTQIVLTQTKSQVAKSKSKKDKEKKGNGMGGEIIYILVLGTI